MAQERDILWRLEIDQDAAISALTQVNKEQDRLKAGLKSLRDEYKKGEVSSEEFAQSQTDIQIAQRKLQQEKRDLIKQTETEKGSVAELELKYKTLLKAIKNTKAGNDVLGRSYEQAKKDASALKDEIDEFKRETGTSVFGDLQASVDGLGEGLGGLAGGFGGLGGILAGGGIAAGVGAVISLGTAVADVVSETVELRRQIEFLSGETGPALDSLSAKAGAIAETFDQDVNEVVKSANSLAKQMDISFDDALTNIEKGFLSGANIQGDFLDQVKEYPSALANSKISAEGLISVISQSGREGVFSDKGIDAIKEFSLRITEQTTATADALEDAFGQEFADELFEGINTGATSSAQAFDIIIGKLNDTELSASQTQTIVADVFGGPGEDAGLAFLKTLDLSADGLDSLIDKNDSLTASQLKNLEVNKELEASQNELAKRFEDSTGTFSRFSTQMETFGTDILVAVIDGVQPIVDLFGELFTAFGDLADAIFPATEEGESFVSFTEVATIAIKGLTLPLKIFIFSLTKVVEFLAKGGKAIKEFVDSNELLKRVFDTIKEVIGEAIGAMQTFFETIGLSDESVSSIGKAATAAKKAHQEETKVVKEEQEEQTKEVKKQSAARLEELKKAAEEARKQREKEFKEALKLQAREEKAWQELQMFRTEQALEANLRILDNENESLDNRLDAIDLASQKELELLAQKTSMLLENEELTESEITRIQEEEDAKRGEIERQATKRRNELIGEENKRIKEQAEFEADKAKAAAEARVTAEEQVRDSAEATFSQLASLAGENEALVKGLALVDVGVNLQKEISAINANAAANPANAVTFGAAGVSQSSILTGLAIGRAALSTATILGFADGGVIEGPSHEGGGVNFFKAGGRFVSPTSGVQLEGDEGVMKKNAMRSNRKFTVSGTPRQIGSALNTSFGGRSWMKEGGVVSPLKFQDGGFFSANMVNDINQSTELNRDLQNFIDNMPQPVVSVREFNDVNKRVSVKENKSSLKGNG